MKTKIANTKRVTTVRVTKSAPPRAKKLEVIELVPALLKIKTILVPIDFCETSRKALVYAVKMAEQFGSKVVLLNVVEPVATADFAYPPVMLDPDYAKNAARKRLETLRRDGRVPAKILGRMLVRYGTPYTEITDAARSLKADLIILTTLGYTGLKRVFMGSTAERVVRHAPCPVLTVREKEHEFL